MHICSFLSVCGKLPTRENLNTDTFHVVAAQKILNHWQICWIFCSISSAFMGWFPRTMSNSHWQMFLFSGNFKNRVCFLSLMQIYKTSQILPIPIPIPTRLWQKQYIQCKWLNVLCVNRHILINYIIHFWSPV